MGPATLLKSSSNNAPKPAKAGQDFGPHGAFYRRLDPLDQLVSGVDVDACVAVGKTVFWCLHSCSMTCPGDGRFVTVDR